MVNNMKSFGYNGKTIVIERIGYNSSASILKKVESFEYHQWVKKNKKTIKQIADSHTSTERGVFFTTTTYFGTTTYANISDNKVCAEYRYRNSSSRGDRDNDFDTYYIPMTQDETAVYEKLYEEERRIESLRSVERAFNSQQGQQVLKNWLSPPMLESFNWPKAYSCVDQKVGNKILIMGNAGHSVSIYKEMLKNRLDREVENLLVGGSFTGASTSTCSAWDAPPLTQKNMMDMIYKMEEALKSCKKDPFSFPFNKPLYEDYNLTERKQIKFPRCNKKKIWKLKRWGKNPANFDYVPDQKIYYTNDFAVCHPLTSHALRQTVRTVSAPANLERF